MEMCYTEDTILKYMPTDEAVESYSRNKDEQLWEALRINHLFNIMHLDIKNDNIGFSKVKNKWVFLDYGMS